MRGDNKGKTSRHLAVLCLVEWERSRQALQPYLESIIYGSLLPAVDRHLAVMLVMGVLRQLQYLDCIIARHAKHPLEKMKPLTRMALRVGVYQLLLLNRIPDSAAVNESVRVLKKERQPRWIVNFVNGVLRHIGREKGKIPGPDQAEQNGTPVLNHPTWLVQRWQKRYGLEKTRKICHRNNREPRLTLRVNIMKTNRERLSRQFDSAGKAVRFGKYTSEALIVEPPVGPLVDLPGYEQGLFHVQDEGAQLVSSLLGPFTPEGKYLDACAGLGGKTCQLAQLLPETAILVAVEPAIYRYQRLQENLRRLGLAKRVQCFQGQISEFARHLPGQFSGILVDAPCSGTGVIGRHPDIRWNRNLHDLQAYQQKQLEILQLAAHLLLPEGTLVYATCSMEPEENEQVVEAFLSGNPDFSLCNVRNLFPGSAEKLVDSAGCFSSTPLDGLDGFFAARLVRSTV